MADNIPEGEKTWRIVECSECDNELELVNNDKDDLEQALDDEEWVCLNINEPEEAQNFLCPDCREADPDKDDS